MPETATSNKVVYIFDITLHHTLARRMSSDRSPFTTNRHSPNMVNVCQKYVVLHIYGL